MDALDTQVCGELPIEYHALHVVQATLQVASRRDAAFDIPVALSKEAYLKREGLVWDMSIADVARLPRQAREGRSAHVARCTDAHGPARG